MDSELLKAITKAKRLFANNRHACIATVNEDGSPHNTPFFFLYENDLSYIYWGSHPRGRHSLNVTRDGRAFLALYNSVTPKLGGVYMALEKCHELQSEELTQALKIHNEFRLRENKEAIPINYYTDDGPQRMYSGTPTKCWVLMKKDGADGLRIMDYRQEVGIRALAPLET